MSYPESSDRTKMLLVLSLLEQGEQTGFGLIRMMEIRREFAFLAEEAMIYPLLHEMYSKGLITSYEKQTEVGIRRFYKVKRQGIHFLSYLRKLYPNHGFSKVGGGVCAKSENDSVVR
ncbi:MAG TPA: PadR family transcriptional regulator [Candidatus Butyricicoccus avistercoris]|uniref:PadR family transcriptional regulator n=1 Tax=Candidatus Butyricicoccus avistercoris TaxID=2838518 RepID=A0A9D1PHK2_9FIRM|nr:PadR family transcriptional regulator [Candidatus Butyricicoccus avistercoris]